MSKVEIPDLAQKLLVLGGRPLGHASVPTELLSLAKEVGSTVRSGSISTVLGASVGVAVHLYNGENDSDDDGIIGAAPGKRDPRTASTDWRPQIPFRSGSAWLKYSLTAEATAKASSKIGSAGGSISGDRSLRLLCYKRHDSGDGIVPAVLGDLDGLASPLSAADILALSMQEATALKIRGNLTARLSLNWADIFSSSLHEFADLLVSDDAGALVINVSSSASVNFTATVDDDFTLCFVREKASGDDAIRVALRKSIKHDQRFLARAGVEVQFADPSAVRDVLAGVLAGVLDAPATALAAIERATSLDSLPEKYRSLVRALAERFGLADADPLKPLKDKLRELDALLTERIERIARTKVRLGLRYEYLRIASEASLLEATLSEAAMRTLHGAMLAFDFAKLLEYKGPGLTLDFFLHQNTVDRVRALGFSLGIGTWLALSSKQTRRDLFVSRRYLSPSGELQTRAYLGSTRYSASINTWSTDYGAMLKADLEEARTAQQTTARDFKCGLHLWWEESRIKPDKQMARIVDDAVLWGVITAPGAAALHKQLSEKLTGIGDCKLRLSVLLGDQGLRQALRRIVAASDADCGRHSARALPWQSRHAARTSCASREAAYSPFFAAYAQVPDSSGGALHRLIETSLYGEAAGLAGQEGIGETPWTLRQVLLRANAGSLRFWQRWHDLRTGAARLSERLDLRGDWQEFDDDFQRMAPSFEQAYLIRAVASLLAQQDGPRLPDSRTHSTTLTISYLAAGKDKTIVVGGKP